MAQRSRQRNVDEPRRKFLGEAFLPYWPPDEWPWPSTEIDPKVIAARCLGINYGDPGPALPPGACRECWGDRLVWLGNCWGMAHAGGTSAGCQHSCHSGVALAGGAA
jgi:hypothetical protein